MGNLTASPAAPRLMSARYRNSGRPELRTITTATGATIDRAYDYDPASAQLMRLAVAANSDGVLVAGSDVTYHGLRLSAAQLY